MMQPSRILIVDDESMNVDLLGQQLADLGYETVVAGGGQEALDKVAEQAPDLILLDVMMPGIDGFEVCRRLKASDETRLIPIVIMTALHEIDDRVKGIEAGADEFLTKPVDKRELQARIKPRSNSNIQLTKNSAKLNKRGITSPSSCRRWSSDWSQRIQKPRNSARRSKTSPFYS